MRSVSLHACSLNRLLFGAFRRPLATQSVMDIEAQTKRTQAMTVLSDWISQGQGHSYKMPTETKGSAVVDPSTGQKLAVYSPTPRNEIDNIVLEAQKAQREWAMVPPLEKSKVNLLFDSHKLD